MRPNQICLSFSAQKELKRIEFAMPLLREEPPGTVGPFPRLGEPRKGGGGGRPSSQASSCPALAPSEGLSQGYLLSSQQHLAVVGLPDTRQNTQLKLNFT